MNLRQAGIVFFDAGRLLKWQIERGSLSILMNYVDSWRGGKALGSIFFLNPVYSCTQNYDHLRQKPWSRTHRKQKLKQKHEQSPDLNLPISRYSFPTKAIIGVHFPHQKQHFFQCARTKPLAWQVNKSIPSKISVLDILIMIFQYRSIRRNIKMNSDHMKLANFESLFFFPWVLMQILGAYVAFQFQELAMPTEQDKGFFILQKCEFWICQISSHLSIDVYFVLID